MTPKNQNRRLLARLRPFFSQKFKTTIRAICAGAKYLLIAGECSKPGAFLQRTGSHAPKCTTAKPAMSSNKHSSRDKETAAPGEEAVAFSVEVATSPLTPRRPALVPCGSHWTRGSPSPAFENPTVRSSSPSPPPLPP